MCNARRRCSLACEQTPIITAHDINDIYDRRNHSTSDDTNKDNSNENFDPFHGSSETYCDIFSTEKNGTSFGSPKKYKKMCHNDVDKTQNRPTESHGTNVSRRCSLEFTAGRRCSLEFTAGRRCSLGFTAGRRCSLGFTAAHHSKIINDDDWSQLTDDRTIDISGDNTPLEDLDTICNIYMWLKKEDQTANDDLANFTPDEIKSTTVWQPIKSSNFTLGEIRSAKIEQPIKSSTAENISEFHDKELLSSATDVDSQPFFTGHLANYHSVQKRVLLEAIEKTMVTRSVVTKIRQNMIENSLKYPSKQWERKVTKTSEFSKSKRKRI